MDRLQSVIAAVEDLKGVKVIVDFAGSGDSGEIHDLSIWDKDDKNVYPWNGHKKHVLDPITNQWKVVEPTYDAPEPTITITVYRRVWVPEDNGFKTCSEDKEMPLVEAIETIAYDDLSDTNVDWYNNEGGSGVWTLSQRADGAWVKALSIDQNVYSSRNVYDVETVVTSGKMTPSMDLSNIDPDVLARAIKRAKEEAQ